ncbi:unnamed protein product [Allacma fusca]|uniref:Uncharacterized protein n=1 Tax=Allacma fusca TaxID=39272 RepID=A0A8J2NUZ7_9HEXA|nr:unnamed protein product [Allacma fusca]
MDSNSNFRKPVMEIVNSRFDMRRKNQVSGSKSGDGALNHPYRRQVRSTDMMDKPISNLVDPEITEGRRIKPSSVVRTSSSSSSGDFRNGDYVAVDLSGSDTVGEESNILGSSTHQQVIGEGDGFDAERKRPHDAAAAADIVGDSSDPAPNSIIDPVKPVVDASNQKIVSCYYRTLPYEGNELTFVYIKRMGKTVNMNISRIPWLIQRLAYYYSLKGDNMQAMGQALENCYNMYTNVASEIDESELDI